MELEEMDLIEAFINESLQDPAYMGYGEEEAEKIKSAWATLKRRLEL